MSAPRRPDLMADFGLGLSRLDAELRAFSLGGSDCTTIAAAENHRPDKKPKMYPLERMMGVKLGDEPDDLGRNVSVMLGIWNEPLIVYLYECLVGPPVFDRNATVDHRDISHCRASLDGRVVVPDYGRCPLEAKWTAMTNIDAVVRQYYSQLQNNLDCDDVDHIVLAVILRGQFGHVVIERDDNYLKVLRERQEIVWAAIEDGRRYLFETLPPMPKPKRDVVVMSSGPVDLSTLPQANEIGDHAAVFRDTYDAARAHKKAREAIVKAVPPWVKQFSNFGIDGKRNAKDALSLVPDNLEPGDPDDNDEF